MSWTRLRIAEILQGVTRGRQEWIDHPIRELERKEARLCTNTFRRTACGGSGEFYGEGGEYTRCSTRR